jgi:hypothetical protein
MEEMTETERQPGYLISLNITGDTQTKTDTQTDIKVVS